jgi:hypothetical protein
MQSWLFSSEGLPLPLLGRLLRDLKQKAEHPSGKAPKMCVAKFMLSEGLGIKFWLQKD